MSINHFLKINYSPIRENIQYNQKLHKVTVFPYINSYIMGDIAYIIIFFRFRSIEFSKKRALPFFLAIELLTHRKCVASLSSRNIQAWKIRKGILVGCKVTLRRESLYDFINILSFTFSRIEKFQPYNHFLFKFYNHYFINKNNSVNFSFTLSLSELGLFYPIEQGLGIHTDVKRVQVTFIRSTLGIEEQFFILRYGKVPVLP